jgi:hypothetical protein
MSFGPGPFDGPVNSKPPALPEVDDQTTYVILSNVCTVAPCNPAIFLESPNANIRQNDGATGNLGKTLAKW